MGGTDRLDAVLRAVGELGLFQTPRRVPAVKDDDTAALEGEVLIEGRWVTIRLVLDSAFPLKLPRFFLHPWDALGFIPHVDGRAEQRGLVCFADPEGLVLDRRRPVQVVEEAFGRAIRVLADGVSGRNRADFGDEFEVYWGQLSGGATALSMLEPGDSAERVIVALYKEQPPRIAGSERDISAYLNGAEIGGTMTLQNGFYLPLEPGTIITPPRPDRPFWTGEEARRVLLPGLSEANRARFRKLVKGRPRLKEYVILRLPRPSEGDTLFGIRYERTGDRHPLLDGGVAERLIPLQIKRRDRGYLVRRGGGDTGLGAKRALLVGCGAVGGHLAFELARAGVLDLTLVDFDVLTPDNSFRHVLGRRHWWKRKVQALKEEIEAELPYVRVDTVENTIEGALAAGSVDLADYDLIVLALGNPTVELTINERLHALERAPAAVFTWLEPLGIGGHALLAAHARGGGCFECLYTSRGGDEATLENRAAFAAPGQSFGRALSGCGSLHTPYGSIDAVRTAALAARLAVDALTGRERGNPLLSWKGDAAAFREAGFRLSRRYGATEDELFRHRYAYRDAGCPACCAREEGMP